MAKMREQNTVPQVAVLHKVTQVTHTGIQPVQPLHSTVLSMTPKNPFKLALTASHQLPAHCPCLYLQACVWCFFEDWKSYRSSLNLRGQAKQTGRQQNSSGCLTHTGFEIMCRPRYLLLNMHIVCTPSVFWFQRRAVKQSKPKYQKILLYLFQTP